MRIIYIITRSDAIGGASIHVRDMAERMLREGHDVLVILGQGELLSAQLRERGIPYHQIDSFKRSVHPIEDSKSLLAIFRKLQSWKPDIVSTHTSKAGLLGRIAAWLQRIPVLYTPHCWSFADNFPNAKLYLFLERFFSFTTTQFIAVSEYERQQGIAAKVCRSSNCRTVHNGMPELPNSGPSNKASDSVKLIMVARFEEQKDHRTLIQSLEQLKHLEWTLDLIGDGPLLAEIHSRVIDAGLDARVHFHGHTSKVASYLSKSDLFILSTLWESFPRSILEAMRAGLPVIASDIGGCSESVIDGVNGYIVPAGNPKKLEHRLEQLIVSKERRHTMGLESRRLYKERFTFERMFKHYLRIYASMLEAKSHDKATTIKAASNPN